MTKCREWLEPRHSANRFGCHLDLTTLRRDPQTYDCSALGRVSATHGAAALVQLATCTILKVRAASRSRQQPSCGPLTNKHRWPQLCMHIITTSRPARPRTPTRSQSAARRCPRRCSAMRKTRRRVSLATARPCSTLRIPFPCPEAPGCACPSLADAGCFLFTATWHFLPMGGQPGLVSSCAFCTVEQGFR